MKQTRHLLPSVLGAMLLVATTAIAAPPEEALIKDALYVAYDLETTGFSAKNDRIVELGAVKFRGDDVIAEKRWLINPGIPIPSQAQKVHGISDAMVANAPSFKTAYPEIREFISGATLVAHNASFDVRFLRAEIERNALTYPDVVVIDTLALARTYYPDAESHKLGAMVELLELPPGTFHRGLEDAVHTMGLLQKIAASLPADAKSSTFMDAATPLNPTPLELQ